MARAPVEIDDEDRSAKGVGAAQQPDARVAAKIIKDQAALPLFSVIRDHGPGTNAPTPPRLDLLGLGQERRMCQVSCTRHTPKSSSPGFDPAIPERRD